MLAFISEKKRQINLRRDKDGMVQDAFCAHVPLTIPRLPRFKGKRKAPKSSKNELVFPIPDRLLRPIGEKDLSGRVRGDLEGEGGFPVLFGSFAINATINTVAFPFGVSEISFRKRRNFESVLVSNLDAVDAFEEPLADRAFAVMAQRGDAYGPFCEVTLKTERSNGRERLPAGAAFRKAKQPGKPRKGLPQRPGPPGTERPQPS